MSKYGIGEWYGEPFENMTPNRRQALAIPALDTSKPQPKCPFLADEKLCKKRGGVCSIREYETVDGRMGKAIGEPVIVCPNRFEQGNLIPRWLAEIAKFDDAHVAREVAFMRDPNTGRDAGRIDIVVAKDTNAADWFGLEIQAVYFSGDSMAMEFRNLLQDSSDKPPQSSGKRRPDWRSSSAKRLMPQLQIKAPTLRRWGKKLAVAVDLPFFEAIGGRSAGSSQDLNEGDIIWLVPKLNESYQLVKHHWEVLSLEASSAKLRSAKPVKREEFETLLCRKLVKL